MWQRTIVELGGGYSTLVSHLEDNGTMLHSHAFSLRTGHEMRKNGTDAPLALFSPKFDWVLQELIPIDQR